jgi:uncharacterized protein (TIGR03086 family)
LLAGFRAHDAAMTTTTIPMPALDLDSAPFGPDDPRVPFGRAVALGGAVLAAVRPEQHPRPTPCPDFDVATLASHLVSVVTRVAAMGRGEDVFSPKFLQAPTPAPTVEAYRAAAHELQAAWTDDATLEQIVTLPWVTAPGAVILEMYTGELTVHTWDLASAIGVRPEWDGESLATTWRAAQHLDPTTNRHEGYEELRRTLPEEQRDFPDPFADAVPADRSAPLIDRIVAHYGRDPRWSA